MIVSKVRGKINNGIRKAKKNVLRVVSKSTKRKFYFGKYYIKCNVIKDRILVDLKELPDEMTSQFVKDLYSRIKENKNEIYFAVDHGDITKVKGIFKNNNLDIKPVDRSSYKYLEILSSSGFIISTHILPPYFVKKDEQNYLHLWYTDSDGDISELNKLIFDNIAKIQHSILQSSYVCFCGKENKKTVIDTLCLSTLYTGKIVSSAEDISKCTDEIIDCLLENDTKGFSVEGFAENKNKTKRLIVPKKIKQKEDFETLKRFVNENDIVQFTAKNLNKSMRIALSEEYKGAFDYIVITPEFPRSYGEEIKIKLGNHDAEEKVELRDKIKKYGKLHLLENEVTDIRVLQSGCSISNAEINNLEAQFDIIEKLYLQINLSDSDRYKIKQLLFADKNNVIVCMKEVSDELNGIIKVDFSSWNDIPALKGSYQILADVWDEQEKKSILAGFTSYKITNNKKEKNDKFCRHASYMEPVFDNKAAYLCYQNKKERLMFVICKPEKVLNQQMQAKLLKMKAG